MNLSRSEFRYKPIYERKYVDEKPIRERLDELEAEIAELSALVEILWNFARSSWS